MPIDFEERMITKMDLIDQRIRDLCERLVRTEERQKQHFLERDKKIDENNKKFYYIISFLTVGFTLYEIFKGLT